MIEFNSTAGSKVAVNPMLVFAAEAGELCTHIVSAAGGVVSVAEPLDEVQRRVKAWTREA